MERKKSLKHLCSSCKEVYLEETQKCPLCGVEESPYSIINLWEFNAIGWQCLKGKTLRSKTSTLSVTGQKDVTLNGIKHIYNEIEQNRIVFVRDDEAADKSIWSFKDPLIQKDVWRDLTDRLVYVNLSQRITENKLARYEKAIHDIIGKVDEAHPQLRQYALDQIRAICENATNKK